jgi:hypothetical protein
MSAFPKLALRSVASELRQASVASVSFVASPVASVASDVAFESPRSVIARALLRARKVRSASKVQRIARRHNPSTEVSAQVSIPGIASDQAIVSSRRLH